MQHTDLSELAPDNARIMGLGVGKPLLVKVIDNLVAHYKDHVGDYKCM